MTVVFAPACCTASDTVSNIGIFSRPATLTPPLPGVTPATTRVPYSTIWRAWNAPAEPDMPWTTRRVLYPTRTLMLPRLLGGLDHLLGTVGHVGHGDDIEPAVREHLLAEFD